MYADPKSPAEVIRSVILTTLLCVVLSLATTWAGLALWLGVDTARLMSVGQAFEAGAVLSVTGSLILGAIMNFHGLRARFRLVLAKEELRRASEIDPLTGLLNRRGLECHVAEALRQRGGGAWPATALLLDLDHFKNINDAHGHAFGDAALRRLAEALREAAERASGAIVARYGGEEFIVLLLGAGLDEAGRFADWVRGAYSARPVEWNGARALITMSVGLAATLDASAGVEDLIAKADAALYEAKRSGRDRVCGPPSLALAS